MWVGGAQWVGHIRGDRLCSDWFSQSFPDCHVTTEVGHLQLIKGVNSVAFSI